MAAEVRDWKNIYWITYGEEDGKYVIGHLVYADILNLDSAILKVKQYIKVVDQKVKTYDRMMTRQVLRSKALALGVDPSLETYEGYEKAKGPFHHIGSYLPDTNEHKRNTIAGTPRRRVLAPKFRKEYHRRRRQRAIERDIALGRTTAEEAKKFPENYGRALNVPTGGRRRKRKTIKRPCKKRTKKRGKLMRKKTNKKRRKRKTKNMRKKKGGVPGKNKKIGKLTSKKKPTERKKTRRVRFIECETDENCDGTKICRGGICVEEHEIPQNIRSRSERRTLQRQRRLSRASAVAELGREMFSRGTAAAASAPSAAAAAAPQLTRTDSIRYQVGPAAASAAAAAPPPQLTRTDSISHQVGPAFGHRRRNRSWADIERLLGNLASKSNRGGRKTKRRR